MNNLVQHISKLIAYHNCVIIPGFGAFLAHKIPAYYNTVEQCFIPPHRKLGFNPEVTMDDALLTSDYMKVYALSYDEAARKLQEDVKTFRSTLSSKGEIRMEQLGTLFMDINGKLTFSPEENGIDDPANFGFEPLNILQLHLHNEKTITIRRRDFRKFIAAAAAIVLMFTFVTPISDHTQNIEMKASLGGFASSENISMMQQLSTSTPKLINETEACEIEPIEYSITEKVTSTNISETTVSTCTGLQETATQPVALPATESIESNESKKFHIIVASSPTPENAELAIKELNEKFEAEYTVIKCNKRHRIAIGTYENANEAQEALSQYHKIFVDAWVLEH